MTRRILKTTPGENDYRINKTHLFPTNAQVDCHNNAIYNVPYAAKAQIKAMDIVVGDMSDELKDKMKEKIPDDPTKTMGLCKHVSVAVGSKYDLTTNVNVIDGMTNGAECIVKMIDYRVKDSTRPSIIWVSFPEHHMGRSQRKEYAHLYHPSVNKSWTPILEITRQFKILSETNLKFFSENFLYDQQQLKLSTVAKVTPLMKQ